MELLGFDNSLSGVATQALSLSAIPLQASFLSPNTYGLSRQSDSNSQIPLIQFDVTTGWLQIAGDAGNNIVKQTVTNNGYYQFDIDGNIFSSDRDSSFFLQSLAGATSTSVVGINFDGGLGYDILIVGNQGHSQSFGVIADDKIQIQGEVHSESIFFKAQDIVNQGAILAQNVTAEFSNSYTDVADAKVIASNGGNILLNGGKAGNLQASGQFLANGTVGGKIDFRAKTIGLSGANLDASGENGGGTILIGGDYQGGDSTDLGTLANAQSTFINKNSIINANAFTNGNGGKVIVWSDINTNFQGNINARGGEVTGDGGFVEVSGKQNLNFVGEIDVKANSGKTGSILLDPTDLIINGDDGDESTFDISDLQKLEGDITLSATNDIIFNTMGGFGDNESDRTINLDAGNMVSFNAPFSIYATSVNINAGGTVNFYDSFYANGGNLNISGASITGFGSLESLNSMSLTSRDAINLENSTIRNYGDGEIVLNAGTYINLGGLYFDSGNSVNVNLSANEDIDIYSIYSNGNIQDFSAVSTIGDINLERQGYGSGDLYASGNIALDAYGDIVSSGFVLSGSSVNILSRTGKIDTDRARISSAVNGLNAGDITLKADTSICVGELLAYGEKTGGNVNVSANGNVLVGSIETFTSIGGKSGDISVVSTQGDIYLGYYGNAMLAINANGDNKIGGKVVLNAYGSVGSTNIYAGAYTDGVGSSVNIISQTGSITVQSGRPDIGNEISTSSGSGNAGDVILNSAFDIKVGNIATNSSAGGDVYSINGGANTLECFGITEGSVFASSSGGGNGGYVNLTASRDIETLNISTTSINGNAGNVEITANGDILTKAIASNVTNSSGDGGNISLISDLGNIQIDYARSDSAGDEGGNIILDAAKSVRVTGSFSFDDVAYSIYADGLAGNSTVEISYDDIASFAIGNADINGTFGAIANSNYILLPPDSPIALPESLIVGKLKILDNQSTIAQLSDFAQPLQNLVNTAASLTGNLIGATNDGKATLFLTPIAALDNSKYQFPEDRIGIANVAWQAIFLILESCRKFGVTDKAQIAYVLATAGGESNFGAKDLFSSPGIDWMYERAETSLKLPGESDEQYFNRVDSNVNGNGDPSSGDGFRYRGHGYAQLTYKNNYIKFSRILGVDLINNPDLAVQPNIAADILVKGMKDGLFTGVGLSDYINNGNTSSYVAARAILGGSGSENEIAMMAKKYFKILTEINYV